MAAKEIVSPLPGTFFRRPAPDKPVYKEEGDPVAAGEVIGLVEVMKTFYEVKSDAAGRIARFLVENEAPVQAGDALVVLDV
jgi:acetyl-CoA carboxylase biotin carboxyl carrier protein